MQADQSYIKAFIIYIVPLVSKRIDNPERYFVNIADHISKNNRIADVGSGMRLICNLMIVSTFNSGNNYKPKEGEVLSEKNKLAMDNTGFEPGSVLIDFIKNVYIS